MEIVNHELWEYVKSYVSLHTKYEKTPKTTDDTKKFINELKALFKEFNAFSDLQNELNEPLHLRIEDLVTDFGYNENFENYKREFADRYLKSTDKELLIKLEIERTELKISGTKRKEAKVDFTEIGYLIAVNGENPIIYNLIYNLTRYHVWDYYDLSNHLPNNISTAEYHEECRSQLPNICSGYIRAKKIQFLKEFSKAFEPINQKENTNKIKWLGQVSTFAYLIKELQYKGFLELPRSTNTKDAVILLDYFDIDTTPGSLAKELGSCSLTADNKNMFRIPNIEQVKKDPKLSGK